MVVHPHADDHSFMSTLVLARFQGFIWCHWFQVTLLPGAPPDHWYREPGLIHLTVSYPNVTHIKLRMLGHRLIQMLQ